MKRKKKKTWLFAKFLRLPYKRKSNRRACFLSPQIDKDSSYSLSSGSLNLINENMMISINQHNSRQVSTSDYAASHQKGQREQIERDLIEKDNEEIENGANELDYYMNEIKRKEMRSYEA
jgi:hypothetical protein